MREGGGRQRGHPPTKNWSSAPLRIWKKIRGTKWGFQIFIPKKRIYLHLLALTMISWYTPGSSEPWKNAILFDKTGWEDGSPPDRRQGDGGDHGDAAHVRSFRHSLRLFRLVLLYLSHTISLSVIKPLQHGPAYLWGKASMDGGDYGVTAFNFQVSFLCVCVCLTQTIYLSLSLPYLLGVPGYLSIYIYIYIYICREPAGLGVCPWWGYRHLPRHDTGGVPGQPQQRRDPEVPSVHRRFIQKVNVSI